MGEKLSARADAKAATEAFAADTDDPQAALAAFRQVLAEVEGMIPRACADYTAEGAYNGRHVAVTALQQAVVLAHGLARLVERCMEPWDEDTWRDYLRDCAKNGWNNEAGLHGDYGYTDGWNDRLAVKADSMPRPCPWPIPDETDEEKDRAWRTINAVLNDTYPDLDDSTERYMMPGEW